MPTYGNVRQGFVYERVPHITLRDIANNAEIDVIWEEYQDKLEPLREALNRALETAWEEWEIPRGAEESWPEEAQELHRQWWEKRIARQKEIDASISIAARAEYEYLYDKPYEDRSRVRVAGPFTVGSHLAPPGAGRGRERRRDRRHRRGSQRLRHGLRLRPDHSGQPAALRGAAGPPRGPH